MGDQRGLTAVSSFHVKGGCGKTTVLSSVGVYLAYATQLNVMAVDMDIQGALYTTLLRLTSAKRYPPEQRHRYYEQFMQGFKPANTKYAEVNQRLKVAHYPLEMFANDRFSQETHTLGFEQRVKETAKGSSVLLLDLPPGRLSTNDVKPFVVIDDIVDSYKFLIPSRPVLKEVYDGIVNFLFVKSMLVAEGVAETKISGMLALNFNSVRRGSDESKFLVMLSDYCMRQGGAAFLGEDVSYAVMSDFPDVERELREKRIGYVTIPQAIRTKEDMQQYCVLLDRFVDLLFLEHETLLRKWQKRERDAVDCWYDLPAILERNKETAERYSGQTQMLTAHIAFLEGIVTLASYALSNWPEVAEEMLKRTRPPDISDEE